MLHSSVRVKYGALQSCWKALTEQSERFQASSTAKASVSQRMPCLACASALAGRSVAVIQSQDFLGDCPAALGYRPLSSCAACSLLFCFPSWVWASFLHFCWVCLFVVCFLFSELLTTLSIFKKRKTVFTDLNFGSWVPLEKFEICCLSFCS